MSKIIELKKDQTMEDVLKEVEKHKPVSETSLFKAVSSNLKGKSKESIDKYLNACKNLIALPYNEDIALHYLNVIGFNDIKNITKYDQEKRVAKYRAMNDGQEYEILLNNLTCLIKHDNKVIDTSLDWLFHVSAYEDIKKDIKVIYAKEIKALQNKKKSNSSKLTEEEKEAARKYVDENFFNFYPEGYFDILSAIDNHQIVIHKPNNVDPKDIRKNNLPNKIDPKHPSKVIRNNLPNVTKKGEKVTTGIVLDANKEELEVSRDENYYQDKLEMMNDDNLKINEDKISKEEMLEAKQIINNHPYNYTLAKKYLDDTFNTDVEEFKLKEYDHPLTCYKLNYQDNSYKVYADNTNLILYDKEGNHLDLSLYYMVNTAIMESNDEFLKAVETFYNKNISKVVSNSYKFDKLNKDSIGIKLANLNEAIKCNSFFSKKEKKNKVR